MQARIFYDAFSEATNRTGEHMTEIATVDLDGFDQFDFKAGDTDSLMPVLEYIFKNLNSINSAWYDLPEDSRVSLSEFTKAQGGARSMSVGDYVQIGDRAFTVAAFGFEEVPLNQIEEKRSQYASVSRGVSP